MKSYYDSDHNPIYAEIQYKNNQQSSGPGFWKFNNSILDNKEFVIQKKLSITATNSLTSVNVTAKIARKMLVLEMLKPPNVEVKLVEQNFPVKAIQIDPHT